MTVTADHEPMSSIRKPGTPFFIIPFIISTAFLMEALDSNIITASIPVMADAFGISPIRLNLAITSYIISLGIFIPISGWIADRYGARRIFLYAICLFTFGSILCGASVSFEMLVASRILQGVGGALMTPVGRLILLRSFKREELVAAISYMTMPVLIGPLVGPLLGGFLTTYAHWRWIFFINIPIGLIGIFAALRYINNVPPEKVPSFDVRGFFLVAAAIVMFQTTIENFVHPFMPNGVGVMMIVGASGLCLGLAFYAKRVAHPVVDISLFGIRPFRNGVIFGGISRIGMNSVPFLLQLKLQLGMGYSPLAAGGLVFLTAFGALSLKLMTRKILAFTGFRLLLSVNAIFGGALTACFALLDERASVAAMALLIFVFGFSRSLQFNAINALTYADVPKERQSGSVALAGAVQQITMGLGVSLSAVLLARAGGDHNPDLAAFDHAFVVMGAVPLLSALGFMTLKAEDGGEASGHHPARPKA